jgi:hypothetical protein
VPAGRGLRASRPGWFRHGSCAGMSKNACGWHGNACQRAGPGQGVCVGQNKTRSPPCMRCRGPCLASPHRSASCLAFPMPRAARQSQEPARGVGFPTPPTSRSCLRAVPVPNGESISTASARDRASPCRIIFRVFHCPHSYPQNMTGYPHSNVRFPPPYAQSFHRLPGVRRGTPSRQAGRRSRRRRNFAGTKFDFPAFAVCVTGNDQN